VLIFGPVLWYTEKARALPFRCGLRGVVAGSLSPVAAAALLFYTWKREAIERDAHPGSLFPGLIIQELPARYKRGGIALKQY